MLPVEAGSNFFSIISRFVRQNLGMIEDETLPLRLFVSRRREGSISVILLVLWQLYRGIQKTL